MLRKKNIFVIIGSASRNSGNLKLIDSFAEMTTAYFNLIIYNDLKKLPHFDPELTDHPPQAVADFRNLITNADGVLICTPEYIFSIPSGLKNALEWCVSTSVFSDKPIGLITASANGEKGHEELQLIMKTLMAKFNSETTLLIQGVKGKIDSNGKLMHEETIKELNDFIIGFRRIVLND
ncbi:MAG: NAD(P)H-dependent oxidoreductase [Arcicella sp.]|nr:NAD(P)H-dependent oxidoreductase [Arcicella sp.]